MAQNEKKKMKSKIDRRKILKKISWMDIFPHTGEIIILYAYVKKIPLILNYFR